MDLEKLIQEYDVDSGGVEGIKGFNFQHASIIYCMYLCYILEKDFKVFPETIEDFLIIIDTGKDKKETHKIQAKKSRLSINEMKKNNGVFDKLIKISEIDNFYVSLQINGFKQARITEERLDKKYDINLNMSYYTYEHEGVIIKIYELPFSAEADHMRTYICGLSHDDRVKDKKKVQIAGYFDILFRIISGLSTITNKNANEKMIGMEFFKKLENLEKKEDFINRQINNISQLINPKFADILQKRITTLRYSNEELSNEIEIELVESIKEYYLRCEKIIENNKLKTSAIDEVAKVIIKWSEDGI